MNLQRYQLTKIGTRLTGLRRNQRITIGDQTDKPTDKSDEPVQKPICEDKDKTDKPTKTPKNKHLDKTDEAAKKPKNNNWRLDY